MYINKLLLKEFGKFKNKEIRLKPGINLVYGDNEAGKTTIKEFIVGMFYGIDKSRGLGARLDNYELRKPVSGAGYSGKAYVTNGEDSYLLERSFLRTNKSAVLTEIKTGKEIQLKKPNSYKDIIFDTDKSTYINTLCIGEQGAVPDKELAESLSNYMVNISTTQNADIDKAGTVKYLKNQRRRFEDKKLERDLADCKDRLADFGDVEKELEDVRLERAKELDSYNMEIARLKREARELLGEKREDSGDTYQAHSDKSVSDTEVENRDQKEQNSDRIFLEVEALNTEDEAPKKKPITDNIFVIMAAGIMVVAVVMLIVHLLKFQKSIQQLFTICSVAFVAITIIDGMYRKGNLNDDYVPEEEDFDKVVYELERATEARKTVRIEIDRQFQEDHDKTLEELNFREHIAMSHRDEYYELLEKRERLSKQFQLLETEKKAIDLAISTINSLSTDIYNDFGSMLNQKVSEMVGAITDGKYTDIKIDENLHISVLDNDHFMDISYLSKGTIEQIYLAVRICAYKILSHDQMPIIVDDIFTSYDAKRLFNTLNFISGIDMEQIIIFTSDEKIGDILDDLSMEYNYVEL